MILAIGNSSSPRKRGSSSFPSAKGLDSRFRTGTASTSRHNGYCGTGRGNDGFLLADALIGMAMLSLAWLAAAEAYSSTRSALKRAEKDNALAACAEGTFIGLLLNGPGPAAACAAFPSWRVEVHPEKIGWGTEGEEFETVLPRNDAR